MNPVSFNEVKLSSIWLGLPSTFLKIKICGVTEIYCEVIIEDLYKPHAKRKVLRVRYILQKVRFGANNSFSVEASKFWPVHFQEELSISRTPIEIHQSKTNFTPQMAKC